MSTPQNNEVKPYTITGANQINPLQNSLSPRFLVEHDMLAVLALCDKYIHHDKLTDENRNIENFLWQIRCHVETAHCRYRYMMDNSERRLDDF